MKHIPLLMFVVLLPSFYACRENDHSAQARKEISQTEKDFCDMAARKGIQAAFTFYAADSGIVRRGETLIIGKNAIHEHYGKSTLREVKLIWAPDYVDASASGDLGYTWGHYTFSAIDTSGQVLADSGIFHTVWKRQQDGTWRFVWD